MNPESDYVLTTKGYSVRKSAITPAQTKRIQEELLVSPKVNTKFMNKAAIDAAIADAQKACGGWADWWGEDTKPGGAVKTEAKAEIWSDAAGFEAAGKAYMTAEAAVLASTDEASFKAAFPALGKSCQGCHEKFRQAD